MGRRRLSDILLDTHAWAWSLTDEKRLSPRAIEAIKSAETVSVSAISLYEIGQKVRLGKWSGMAPYSPSLLELAQQQGVLVLPLSAEVSLVAAILNWEHRDPFDRFISATAMLHKMTLVSADIAFDQLEDDEDWPGRIW